MAADAPSNPFRLPSDEEVFLLREQERERKTEERRTQAQLHVWEKTTQSSRVARTARVTEEVEEEEGEGDAGTGKARRTHSVVDAATKAVAVERRREKENMAEFIAKKREMFLVQMSLDTKRDEIRKLEEKARMKEEALRKSELMLEEDAMRFDTFLKENDAKALEAIKHAEAQAKIKQDKAQEVKRLNQQIQAIQGQMSKLKEQLEACERYKQFLDELTPREHIEEELAKKRSRQEARLQKRREAMLQQWHAAKAKAVSEAKAAEQAEVERLVRDGRSRKAALEKVQKDRRFEPVVPPKPNVDALPLTSSGEELPMYFKEPQQLLDIFTALEEANLFLIQNSQDTEQALEELKQNFRETKRKMDSKTRALEDTIADLRAQIAAEEGKASALKERAQAGSGEDMQDSLLQELREKVKEVYRACGFDASKPTLQMLTDLEARLEELLSSIETMDPAYVARAEKEKEKQRRDRVREERLRQQQQAYEERLRKSMLRAQLPVHKKAGKQVMFRSRPLERKKRREQQNTDASEELADARYFT